MCYPLSKIITGKPHHAMLTGVHLQPDGARGKAPHQDASTALWASDWPTWNRNHLANCKHERQRIARRMVELLPRIGGRVTARLRKAAK